MEKFEKTKPALMGLYQALAVFVYIVLLSLFFQAMNNSFQIASTFLVSIVMLGIIVFSVAATGTFVFAVPAYLFLNKKTKQALSVVGFTLLYCLILVALFLLVLALI